MREILISRLLRYMEENNPDLMWQLMEKGMVASYVVDKLSVVEGLLKDASNNQPLYIKEEACFDILTEDLKPSKYHYILNILEEDFNEEFKLLDGIGVLKPEIINMVNYCSEVFSSYNFGEANEDDRHLRYEMTGMISEYFYQLWSVKGEKNGVQYSTEA
ncbi:MAG: DUF1896 family protein [Ginsengibacter sp.]